MFSIRRFVTLVVGVVWSSLAYAHPEWDMAQHSWISGFVHPILGLDHLLVAVAVGLLAGRYVDKRVISLPLLFCFGVACGWLMGFFGIELAFKEQGILLSLLLVGFALCWTRAIPASVLLGCTFLGGMFHGNAHGVEMPTDISVASYATGFLIATFMLHLSGVALVRVSSIALNRAVTARALRVVGAVLMGTAVVLAIP